MKIKANGIAFNYEISGPDTAPWLIFSNSLATNLQMWDPQAEALKGADRPLHFRIFVRGRDRTDGRPRYQARALVRRVDGLRHRYGTRPKTSRPL